MSNGIAPIWNCVLDLAGTDFFNSYRLSENAFGLVSPNCGMLNGSGRGAHIENGSSAVLDSAVFTGFQQAGLHVSRLSDCQCSFADFSGNSKDPSNNFGGIYASRSSRIHGADIDARNSGANGVRAQRQSIITVPGINVSGSTGAAFVAASAARIYSDINSPVMLNLASQAAIAHLGALIVIGNNNITFLAGVTSPAIECRESQIIINNCGLSGHESMGIFAKGAGASVQASNINIAGGTDSIFAEETATVNAAGCTVTGASLNGVIASAGSRICITNGSVTGSGSNDLAVTDGGSMFANGCTTTNGAGSPNASDTNLTGGFNFSDNGNRGLMWT
jgi:hypothetical protein